MVEGEAAAEQLERVRRTGAALCHRITHMSFNLALGPLVSLIAGILILIMPRLLNYIVAIYLILIGLIGLFGPIT